MNVDLHWIGLILSGDKTIELRSCFLHSVRECADAGGEVAALLHQGKVYGLVHFVGCRHMALEEFASPEVQSATCLRRLPKGWTEADVAYDNIKWHYAWEIGAALRFESAVTLSHTGQGWVKLTAAEAEALHQAAWAAGRLHLSA